MIIRINTAKWDFNGIYADDHLKKCLRSALFLQK